VHEVAGPSGAPTLVLLHGWTATGALNWFPCFGPLGRRFRVIAMDQRGHGRGIRRRFTIESCADDVVALADALGIGRVIPVGYSMGGPVAQMVWRRHPRRVDGLVLCATSRNFASRDEARFAAAVLPGMAIAARLVPPVLRQRVAGAVFQQRRVEENPFRQWVLDEIRRSDPAALVEAGRALGSFSSKAWIGDVDVPTAVVVTAADRLVAPERQVKLARAVPGATMHVVNGGHDVCVSRPDLFVPVLVDACESVRRRAGRRGVA
jgi:3-oxoadipate enol-lactonase